ncbi:hypothetical protein J7K74_03540 [Candidatus Woesearchaeota archaeon]|nr:hypothetical protein [Candidatus Woesearchaeota archaeon]
MDYKEMLREAMEEVRVADHMLIMTYPLVRDPKMLLAIIQKLLNACEKSLTAATSFEYEWKRINALPKEFMTKLKLLKEGFQKDYGFTPQELKIVKEVYNIIQEHRTASIEFSRHEKFIISNNDYRLRTITQDQIKRYVPIIKSFIEKIKKRIDIYESWKNKAIRG